MNVFRDHEYYTYITTNPEQTVLYTGVTNNLEFRLMEHWANRGQPKTFAGKYYCFNLIYYEFFSFIDEAIAREKEIKSWNRKKKMTLIKTKNPDWAVLNLTFCRHWPPKELPNRY